MNRVLNKLTIDGQPATPQLPQSMQGYPGQMPPQYAAQMQQQAYAAQMQQQQQAYPSSFQMPQQGYPGAGQSPQMMPVSQAQGMPAVAAGGAVPTQQAGHLIYNRPSMPEYAWPSYASYDNYAQVTYPSAYDASAWPYIGPFYPYPQVPMGWRNAKLEWDDGHWQLKFNSRTDKWWWFLDPTNWHD